MIHNPLFARIDCSGKGIFCAVNIGCHCEGISDEAVFSGVIESVGDCHGLKPSQ